MFGGEALLKQNKELKVKCDDFISLVGQRWKKYKDKEPDEFAVLASESIKKVDEAFAATSVGSTGTVDQKEGLREAFHRFLYGKAYQKWKTKKIIEEDKAFAEKMGQAYALLDPKYMGLDPEIMTDPLFDSAVRAFNQLGDPNSPEGYCGIINDSANINMIILENHGLAGSADDLLPMFVLVLARSEVHNVKSILEFIDDFFDPSARKGRFFCQYVNLVCALGYVKEFKPGTFIVRCKLSDTMVPEALESRIDPDMYNNVLKWLRDAKANTNYDAVRAKGGAIGGAIALAVAAPIAILVGVATVGTGIPFSAGILAGAAAIGAGGGAVAPPTGRKLFDDIRKQVKIMNHSLESHAIELIDPFETNKMNATSPLKNIEDIAWLVRIRESDEKTDEKEE